MKRKVPDRIRVRRGPKKGRYDRGLFGHLAFADGAQPICIPMLHARVGDTLDIHGSTASRAVRALSGGAAACLTVTMLEGLVLARSAFEHSANYDSVPVCLSQQRGEGLGPGDALHGGW